jgi:hypothetical protein
MAHFAKLDKTNVVLSVEAINNDVINNADGAEQEQLGIDFLTNLYGSGWFKQTSYNGNFRKNYAAIGFTYDKTRDAFIPPQPYPSWTLNETTCQWESPVAMPDDDKQYTWNETDQQWDEVS